MGELSEKGSELEKESVAKGGNYGNELLPPQIDYDELGPKRATGKEWVG